MSTEEKIALRGPDTADDVAPHTTEVLHLDITADFFELLRNVIGSGRCPSCRRLTTFACRICKPAHVTLEPVHGNGGQGQQRKNEGGEE